MIDLITGHQGVPHISAEQVSTINNVMMYGYGQDTVVRLKDGTISQDGLEILFAAGYWRANGYDIQITEDDSVILDPTSAGMSRIDVVYAELLQDIPSGVQRVELVVVQGTESAAPTEPPVPVDPQLTTDLLILALPVVKGTVTESTMVIEDETISLQQTENYIEFIGTAADWTAVVDKSIYDGKKVNIIGGDESKTIFIYNYAMDQLEDLAGDPSDAYFDLTRFYESDSVADNDYNKGEFFRIKYGGRINAFAVALKNIEIGDSLVEYSNFELRSVSAVFKQKQEQIDSMNNSLGAKNLLPYPYYETSKASGGLTYTDGGDGRVAIFGTASSIGTFTFALLDTKVLEPDTEYIMNYTGAKGSGSTFYLCLTEYTSDNRTIFHITFGGGVKFKTDQYLQKVTVDFQISNGAFIDTTIAPMIRLATDPNDTWAPFAKTNKELTDDVASINSALKPLFKEQDLSNSASIAYPNATSIEIPITIPTGYRLFTYAWNNNSIGASTQSLIFNSNKFTFYVKNISGGTITCGIKLKVIYIRDDGYIA